jgi:hypothetical protein
MLRNALWDISCQYASISVGMWRVTKFRNQSDLVSQTCSTLLFRDSEVLPDRDWRQFSVANSCGSTESKPLAKS